MARPSASLHLPDADVPPAAAATPLAGTTKASSVRWRIFAIVFALTMAVSYTHLTLPTICSV